jgi:S1-C subfamily serine protease
LQIIWISPTYTIEVFVLPNRIYSIGLYLLVASNLVQADQSILPSVAQVRVTGYEAEFENPWQKGSGSTFSGSAVLIDGNRLITNAHVVSLPLRIEVKRGDSNRWYKAAVQYVSDASDLAMLVVKDKRFYEGGKPVAIGIDIAIGRKVSVVGFPVGGDSVSITEGILSRTEVTTYAYSGMENLTYQLDAAINAGNSGGAVLHKGKLIGISTQAIDGADNIGYAIPVPVINQFIDDVEDGNLDGVPILPFITQSVFNPVQREFYGIGDRNGLRIVEYAGPKEDRCLSEGDIILSVEGLPIGPDGLIRLENLGSASIDYLASRKQLGDSVEIEIAASNSSRSVSCDLNWTWHDIFAVTPTTYNYRPAWAQVGGIVLLEMTDEIFAFLADSEITLRDGVSDAESALQTGSPEDPDRYLFVVNVLRDDINEGYEVKGLLLETFNGERVRNINHLEQLLETNSFNWVELVFNNGASVVFRTADLPALNERLEQEYAFATGSR